MGAEIGADFIRFLLADLEGRELGGAEVALSHASSTPSAVCTLICNEVRALLRKHAQTEEQLLGLVVGVPAIVNVTDGIVVALTALQDWRGVPLGTMLSARVKCPVIVENDTNLAAQGEYSRGSAMGEENFVFITIGQGVGAGVFMGGRIYRGSQWSAGEIGYLRVPNVSRENPTIHAYGRLEKVLGASGILKSWRAATKRAPRNPPVKRAAEVFDLAAAGNAQAKRILQQRAVILADVVLDIALILNPSVILLGGDVGNHPRLLQEVTSLLAGSEVAVVRVNLGALGSSAVLWGAVHTALDSAIPGLIPASKAAV
jgi:glucokinase